MFGERFYRFVERMEAQQRQKTYKTTPPRTMDDVDYDLIDVAVRARRHPIGSQEEIVRYLNSKNPVRVARMRRDFKWCQKHYRRLGLNPEDAVHLL